MTIRDSFGPEPPDEQVERLLTDAAGWEPDEPAPVGLAYSALARMEQEQEPRRRRRAAGRVAIWAGLFMGAGACCASIVMALTATHPSPQAEVRLPASSSPVTLPEERRSQEPIRAVEAPAPALEVPGVETPSQPLRLTSLEPARRRTRYPRTRREEPLAVLRTQWVDHRVAEEVDGVMASGWVAEPAGGGDVRISPALIDVPTHSRVVHAGPATDSEPNSPAPSPGLEGVNR